MSSLKKSLNQINTSEDLRNAGFPWIDAEKVQQLRNKNSYIIITNDPEDKNNKNVRKITGLVKGVWVSAPGKERMLRQEWVFVPSLMAVGTPADLTNYVRAASDGRQTLPESSMIGVNNYQASAEFQQLLAFAKSAPKDVKTYPISPAHLEAIEVSKNVQVVDIPNYQATKKAVGRRPFGTKYQTLLKDNAAAQAKGDPLKVLNVTKWPTVARIEASKTLTADPSHTRRQFIMVGNLPLASSDGGAFSEAVAELVRALPEQAAVLGFPPHLAGDAWRAAYTDAHNKAQQAASQAKVAKGKKSGKATATAAVAAPTPLAFLGPSAAAPQAAQFQGAPFQAPATQFQAPATQFQAPATQFQAPATQFQGTQAPPFQTSFFQAAAPAPLGAGST
jgi:hypothetical protein